MSTSVVLITGASGGLGRAVALAAADAGFRVYASMRDPAKAGVLAQTKGLTVLPLDVEHSDSVNAAVAEVIAAEGRIDALIANAGIGFVRTTEQATEADISWVMNVNFMGVVRCVKAVLPHMRAAGAGRVIAVSSVGGLVGQPFNEVYCASKFAVEGYMESLASYLGPAFGLHFSLVEPGGISSDFAASAFKHYGATGGMVDDDYLPLIQRYLGGAEARSAGVFQTPEAVAQVVLQCLQAEKPAIRIRTSDWAENFTRLKTLGDPDGRMQQAEIVQTMLGGL